MGIYKEKGKYFSGNIGDTNQAQDQVLLEFKDYIKNEMKISNEIYDDWFLLRFCRARKFKLNDTKIMFTNYIKFIEDEKVYDSLLKDDMTRITEQMHQNYPHGFCTVSKDGTPVWIERLKEANMGKLLEDFSETEIKRYFMRTYFMALHAIFPKCSEKADKRIGSFIFIFDLKDVSVGKLIAKDKVNMVKLMLKIGQDYFPEQMCKTFMINAPWSITAAWNLVKVFLDDVTRKKVSIIGSKFHTSLFALINQENQPEALGGTANYKFYEGNEIWNGYVNECFDKGTYFPDEIQKGDPLKCKLWKEKVEEATNQSSFDDEFLDIDEGVRVQMPLNNQEVESTFFYNKSMMFWRFPRNQNDNDDVINKVDNGNSNLCNF